MAAAATVKAGTRFMTNNTNTGTANSIFSAIPASIRMRKRATAAEIVLQHVWSVGDVVMWDNTGTMHRGRPFTSESGRDMHRFTLAGHESIR